MEIIKPVESGKIYHTAKVKEYPTHYEVCVANRDFFRESGWEERGREPALRTKRVLSESERREGREKAQRRARAAIRDIALCSEFTHFVTLTLDEQKIERFDYKEIMRRVNRWLSNMVQRRGLAYVLIPERHKKGGLHFHGLVRGDLALTKSCKRTKRGLLYNWDDWKFGFSSVEELDEHYEKAVSYVCKYISKGSENVGGRWYLSGGKIKKPNVLLAECDWQSDALKNAKAYIPQNAFGLGFKYTRLEK